MSMHLLIYIYIHRMVQAEWLKYINGFHVRNYHVLMTNAEHEALNHVNTFLLSSFKSAVTFFQRSYVVFSLFIN